MEIDMTVRIEQTPSLNQQMVEWLWDAYTTQNPIEWNGVMFKVSNMETTDAQVIVELTPIQDEQ